MDTSEQETKRRRRTTKEKRRIVLEALKPDSSVSQIAQKYALNARLIYRWRKEYREGCWKNGAAASLLPVKVSDEPVAPGAKIEDGISQAPLGTLEIQLAKGKLHITGRVDLLSLRTAIECLAP